MASLPEHLKSVPAGRDPLSREVLADHQRDRVLANVIEVFAKRGYQGTTVDNLLVGARVGISAFYSLFDGKEDCFLRAYDRIVSSAWDRIATEVPAEAPWPEQATAALQALLKLIASEPHPARLAIVEVQTAGANALGRYEETLERIAPLLRRGREQSSLAAELPETLEDAIVAGVAWLLHQRLVTGELDGIEALAPELHEIVIAPYVGDDLTHPPVAGRAA